MLRFPQILGQHPAYDKPRQDLLARFFASTPSAAVWDAQARQSLYKEEMKFEKKQDLF